MIPENVSPTERLALTKQIDTPVRRMRRMLATRCRKTRRQFANDFSFLNPTIWANEAILQLLPNMVTANLIARDFDNQVARFGDIVNAFIPSTFVVTRKGSLCDNVVTQDATGSHLQVALDQMPQVSFIVCDGEENRDQLDLIDTLMTPAVIAQAQFVDRVINAQVYHFLENSAGHLNLGDATTIRQYMLETREKMNRNNVPLPGRAMILGPGTETEALEVEQFTDANKVGDDGTALREAALGRKYGFGIFMTQTVPEVQAGQTTTGTITMNAAAAQGATTIAVTGANANTAVAGTWLSIAGDDTPHQIIGATGSGPYTLTLNTPLNYAVAGAAAVTIIAGGVVTGGPYAGTTMTPRVIGYAKAIGVGSLPANSVPQVGQLVTFGTDTNRYTIIAVTIVDSTNVTITLDRPLVNALSNGTAVNLGPSGKYNFAFLRNAFTLVNRPLATPRAGTGALARVISDPVNKIALRVTITYDGEMQGHRVTLDTLMGVGVLSLNMGAVMQA